jgi:hypothetical protein
MKRQACSSKRSKRQAGEPAPSNAAVAYCRVSTEEQVRGGVSLDAQTERLEAYCRAAGLELVELIREEGKGTHQRFTRCSVTIYTLVLIGVDFPNVV